MLKHSSDALQLSTYTRRSHFVNSVFEYFLVIMVTLAATVVISAICVDEFSNLIEMNDNSPLINSAIDNR
ncbi:hypothetical protein H3S80_02385 [Bartonella sp. M0177]|uniref:hypothetical protein n=1 Tax=Bartonella sp. M0177 TaxID=2750940 RepID=UPI0018DD0D96|nr:hypothetical protein [Bartonella sp. M0177]MBI0002897.1 hypothetical protein [Bartonella sp. M0177]